MARIYKMTVYVCDLDDDSDVEEIKWQIENYTEYASGGTTIVHCSDEEVGEEVNRPENIDAIRNDLTTERWKRYFQEGDKCNT